MESVDLERYKLLSESWRGQRALAAQVFIGSAIATAILALISLGGTWWPHVLGFAYSAAWLALAVQMLSHQDHLYARLEEMADGSDAVIFQSHRFAAAEVKVPRVDRAGHWAVQVSRYLTLGAPAVLVVAWFAGFIVWAVT